MSAGSASHQQALLEAMYDAAVAAAHPSRCLPQHLPAIAHGDRLIILGAGKADAAMAVATEDHYDRLGLLDRLSGLVTTRRGFALPTRRIGLVEASHPVPDSAGVAAAARTLDLVSEAGSKDIVLVLLSGGASALWVAPVAGVTLEDKQALTRSLLKCGATISEINTVRRHISRIKGGRLAAQAYPARLLTLAISDVPGDVPAAIGSGPTVADATTLADARAVLQRYGVAPSAAIARALNDASNETPKPGAAVFANSRFEIVARPQASLEAAAEIAKAAGYEVRILGDSLEGEAREVATVHADLALATRSQGRRTAILSGGEFTVTVTGSGRGGPNQEYALGLVTALKGAAGIHAIAGDTDGIDGGGGDATDPAGAIVTPETLRKGESVGLDAAARLADNDSTAYFKAVGGLLMRGPTQTNVNDFRAILVDP
jgi:hydroxypyruvate reductase